jgi:hypothetical protein
LVLVKKYEGDHTGYSSLLLGNVSPRLNSYWQLKSSFVASTQ